MEEMMELIKEEARKSWSGIEGVRRAARVEAFLTARVAEYAAALGYTEQEILQAIESRRDYSAVNYYQEATFPQLGRVRVFDTTAELLAAVASRRFRCPNCAGVSTDPYTCNSGVEVAGDPCDWKAFGLFKTLGKGFRFAVKETFLSHPVVDEIFMPLEMEQVGTGPDPAENNSRESARLS